MKLTVIPIVTGALGTVPKNLERGIGTIENQIKNRDHQNDIIVVIDQNTKKSLGDLRRFAVTQTPVKECFSLQYVILDLCVNFICCKNEYI